MSTTTPKPPRGDREGLTRALIQAGLTTEHASTAVTVLREYLMTKLSAGQRFELRGLLSLAPYETPARLYQDPRTPGGRIKRPARLRLRLRVGRQLREALE